MDLLKSIVSQKADAERCYFYVDDEKTVRLDKLLGLPNSFEQKKAAMTEKEKQEKVRRDAIEVYYMKATPNSGGIAPEKPKKKKKKARVSKLNEQSSTDLAAVDETSSNSSLDSDTKH